MATHRIPILGAGTLPDLSGSVFFEPYSVKAANDLWQHLVAIFEDTATRIGLRGGFVVPKNYIGSPKIVIIWTSTATGDEMEWDLDYRAVALDEDLDSASAQESLNVLGTSPDTAHYRVESEFALTAANLAVDDFVEFELLRDGTDAGDVMAAAAIVHAVLFEYTDV